MASGQSPLLIQWNYYYIPKLIDVFLQYYKPTQTKVIEKFPQINIS